MLEIGLAAGDTRRHMLCLRTHEDVALMAGDATVPLADLVDFDRGNYAIDANAVRQFIDSTTTADPRYTPSTVRREARKLDTQDRYESWRAAYRTLTKRHPKMSDVWYARKIARQEVAAGFTADTIRKHMKA